MLPDSEKRAKERGIQDSMYYNDGYSSKRSSTSSNFSTTNSSSGEYSSGERNSSGCNNVFRRNTDSRNLKRSLHGCFSKSIYTDDTEESEKERMWTYIKWQFGFLCLLCTVWSSILAVYLNFLDPFTPRMTGLQKLTPGLAIRPQPVDPMSSLIKFRHGGAGNWQVLTSRFNEFTKAYGFGKRLGSSEVCSWNTTLTKDFRCHVGPRKWMALDTDIPCTGAEKYGMYHGRPCVILKLNNVYGWEPEPYYNITEIQEMPKMPAELKRYIQGYWNKHCKGKGNAIEERCPQMRMVWLSCEGETAADEENMGPLSYVPWHGFPGYHYPYLNQQHYLAPVIFIQFRHITPGIIIQVRCKAWARNIEHDDRNPRKGGVHFEIQMD